MLHHEREEREGEAIVIREWQESGKGFFQRKIELEALHGKDS